MTIPAWVILGAVILLAVIALALVITRLAAWSYDDADDDRAAFLAASFSAARSSEPVAPATRAPSGSASLAIAVEHAYVPLPENHDLFRQVRTVRVTVDHLGSKQDFTGPDLVVPFSAAEAYLRGKMGL